QPYAHKSGRCFVAVVDIEVDSLSSCSNRGGRSPTKGNGGKTVRCPTPFWSGRRAGNKQSPDDAALQNKIVSHKTLEIYLLLSHTLIYILSQCNLSVAACSFSTIQIIRIGNVSDSWLFPSAICDRITLLTV
ncbi:MAG: hypothetical protein ACLUKQ_00005, partial [Peptococcaceae bacterium]